ncbi:death domain-associated protein 6 isoform X1 [Pelobates fuscus]|uniref:death domain-associated protein 6 isoform X1 n=1 Tax=Pelobates fuscus TaxID=191477 RepID=UPI002FE476D1
MAHVHDIIVLDDEEEEEKPHCSKVKSSPKQPKPQSNGKKEVDDNQKSATFGAQNNKLFEEFVDYCSSLTLEHPEVIFFLRGKFSRANPSFLSSVEFHNVLGRCLTRVQNKHSKVYVYINELCTALKANSQKRKISLQPSSSVQSFEESREIVDENPEEVKEEETQERKPGSKRQIRYLENLLRIYSREIQKLQERELSLDELEDEDSAYIQEARLKRKLLRIFQKLCDLKNCSSLTGRVIEQKIPYRGTRYPEINRQLEKFINGSQDIFPDYGDVLRVIQKASDRHALGLPRKQIQSMAQDAFRELGNRLQERRHLDLVYNFGCHLTDIYKPGNDPAHMDSMLQRRLRENRSVAMNRLDELIKKYAEMQDDGEEEERQKKKKGGDAHSSSQPSRRQSPESEEEESEEDSDTDIEKELINSQEMIDGEEKDEDEEERPADQDNEADQRMESSSEPPQPTSSGGEEEEDEEMIEERNSNSNEDEVEESVEQDTPPSSNPPIVQEETPTTSLEIEVELLPLERSPVNDTLSQSREDMELGKEESKPEEDRFRGHQALPKICDDVAQEVEKAGPNLECSSTGDMPDDKVKACTQCDTPTDVKGDVNSGTDGLCLENDLSSGSCSVQAGIEVPHEKSSLKDSETFESDSRRSCIEKKTPFTEDIISIDTENIDAKTLQLENYTQIKTEGPCVKLPKERSIHVVSRRLCMKSSVQTEDPTFNKRTANTENVLKCDNMKGDTPTTNSPLSGAESDRNEETDATHDGSSNGVSHVSTETQNSTEMQNRTDSHGLNNHTERQGHQNSSNKERTKDSTPHSRKRKRIPAKLILNNGKSMLNGSNEDESRKEKKCKRARRDCYYSSLLSSPDPASDHENTHDISLDLVVTCSPPESPSSPVNNRLMSNVSTQCDPDEVIVLSD